MKVGFSSPLTKSLITLLASIRVEVQASELGKWWLLLNFWFLSQEDKWLPNAEVTYPSVTYE